MSMLTITQGDTALFDFTATTGEGMPFDLTGATFTTLIRAVDGTNLIVPNDQHTANPDQVTFPGKFTMSLTTDNTMDLQLGPCHEIVTKVVQPSSVIQFHGPCILTVLQPFPIQ